MFWRKQRGKKSWRSLFGLYVFRTERGKSNRKPEVVDCNKTLHNYQGTKRIEDVKWPFALTTTEVTEGSREERTLELVEGRE